MDEALSRGHQHLVGVINGFSAPAREVDEVRGGPQGHAGRAGAARGVAAEGPECCFASSPAGKAIG